MKVIDLFGTRIDRLINMKTKTNILVVFFIFLFTSTFAQQEFTLSGQLKPKGEHQMILLYKTAGAFQYYIGSTSIDSNGVFGFVLPANFEIGTYKAVYNAQEDKYINLIFNQEDISFVFNPEKAVESIYFFKSKENELHFDYIQQMNTQYLALDSIQQLYYATQKQFLHKAYQAQWNKINAYQAHFEDESKGLLVNHFIKAKKKNNSATLFEKPEEYLPFLQKNYFKNIDFNDAVLQNSSFIIDRFNEYIFDLNTAVSKQKNQALSTQVIDEALAKLSASKLKNDMIYSLTNSAFDPYNSEYDVLLEHLYENYYLSLPITEQKQAFKTMARSKINVMEGKYAPQIAFADSNLYEIKSDSVLLVFWSTTCSHCLKEMPEVYQLLKERKNLKVFLIGLEEEYSDWENIVTNYPKFEHLRANGKWENEYAKAYNIKSTPVYFLLDKNKKIIAKPYDAKALKKLLAKD